MSSVARQAADDMGQMDDKARLRTHILILTSVSADEQRTQYQERKGNHPCVDFPLFLQMFDIRSLLFGASGQYIDLGLLRLADVR
ncbi:hypothetical protein, partial [uncultured Duncaniella sp.]|uniref:hypothetical protein n=1 Tax=uncultured Duncaniella sp. TaxID=2768039 RepID=UPI0025AA0B21